MNGQTDNSVKYVVVKKAHGPKGVYRQVETEALPFDQAEEECRQMNINQMTDVVIEFYVSPYNGKNIGELYTDKNNKLGN